MTHGKTYKKSPRRINHKATKSKTNLLKPSQYHWFMCGYTTISCLPSSLRKSFKLLKCINCLGTYLKFQVVKTLQKKYNNKETTTTKKKTKQTNIRKIMTDASMYKCVYMCRYVYVLYVYV